MSLILSKDSVNLTKAPVVLNLQSRFATSKDQTLNNCTFSIGSAISTVGTNYCLLCSIKDMVFFNTFKNITTYNNTLTVFTQYKVNGVLQPLDIIVVTIDPAYYQIQQIIDFLNTAGVCNKTKTFTHGGIQNAYLGLGGQLPPLSTGVVNPDANYPPFYLDTIDYAKIHWQPCPAAAGNLGLYYPEFEYISFGLIIDKISAPLLSTLGLLNENLSAKTIQPIPGTTDTYGLVANVYHGPTAGVSQYTFTQPVSSTISAGAATAAEPYVSPLVNVYRLGGPTSLAISVSQLSGVVATSYQNFSSANTIGIVPIPGAYGTKNVYSAPFPLYNYCGSVSLSDVTIQINDTGTGIPVDFEGSNWEINLLVDYIRIDNSATQSIFGSTTVDPVYTDQNLRQQKKQKYA